MKIFLAIFKNYGSNPLQYQLNILHLSFNRSYRLKEIIEAIAKPSCTRTKPSDGFLFYTSPFEVMKDKDYENKTQKRIRLQT